METSWLVFWNISLRIKAESINDSLLQQFPNIAIWRTWFRSCFEVKCRQQTMKWLNYWLLVLMNARPLFFWSVSVREYIRYDKHVAKYLKSCQTSFSYQAIECCQTDTEKYFNIKIGINYFYNEQIKFEN